MNKIVLRNFKHDQTLLIIYLLLLNYAIYKRKIRIVKILVPYLKNIFS